MGTMLAVVGGFVVAIAGLVVFASTRRPVAEQRAAEQVQEDEELLQEGITPDGDAPWLLNWAGGEEYSLKNVGTTGLRSLQVVALDPTLEITTEEWLPELEPEASQSFRVRVEGAQDPRIMVTWRAEDDAMVQSWTTELPGH